jgi:hypothetical protein
MRLTILLIFICVFALACRSANQSTNQETRAPSPSVKSDEPEHDSPEIFEGTAGVLEQQRPGIQPVTLREVRTGQHAQFDRVVFEFAGSQAPGYRVEYVEKPIVNCGPGEVVQISGNGFLRIKLMPSQAHDDAGKATITERERAPQLPVIKEMKLICDFEADVQWVLGLAAPNRYRVLELSNPTRLVIDVRH